MAPTRLHDRRVFLEGAVASCGGTHLPLKYDGPNFGLKLRELTRLISSGFQTVFEAWYKSCFVYAYMTEMWYYSPVDDKEFEGSGLLCDAYFNIARYHIGSLAYGSLLIFIFRPLRVVLDVLTRPIRKAEEDDENCCVWAVSKVNCCRKGCEKLVGFYKEYLRPLRRSAYMDMAMTGHDFQQSSRDANYFLDGRTVNVSEFDGAALLVATACSFFVSALGAALVRLMCAARHPRMGNQRVGFGIGLGWAVLESSREKGAGMGKCGEWQPQRDMFGLG
ncbi:Slc44a5 [Symbiodinium microadriaticum]|nr:Slc44a5 [Symbiodinium microadriaticum]